MSVLIKINQKIADIQKLAIKNIYDYFQLTKIKGMILEEYVRIGKSMGT